MQKQAKNGQLKPFVPTFDAIKKYVGAHVCNIYKYVNSILLQLAENTNKEWCDGFGCVIDILYTKRHLRTHQTHP